MNAGKIEEATGKHTELPWAATTRQGSWDWVVYSASKPHLEICQPFHDGTEDNPTGEANAALIVRAVNAHEGLVKALEEIRDLSLDPNARATANAALQPLKKEAE